MAQLAKNCKVIETCKDKVEPNIEPMHASMQDLKNGKWCCSEKTGVPGIIANVKCSKTGKHGHAKFTFNLSYPFTEQASQEMFPGHTHLSRPIMTKRECQISYVEGNDVFFFNDEDEQEDAFVDIEWQNKAGENKGEEFHADWEDADEHGLDMYISLLEGPIYFNKGKVKQWVRMVEKWQVKKGDN